MSLPSSALNAFLVHHHIETSSDLAKNAEKPPIQLICKKTPKKQVSGTRPVTKEYTIGDFFQLGMAASDHGSSARTLWRAIIVS